MGLCRHRQDLRQSGYQAQSEALQPIQFQTDPSVQYIIVGHFTISQMGLDFQPYLHNFIVCDHLPQGRQGVTDAAQGINEP